MIDVLRLVRSESIKMETSSKEGMCVTSAIRWGWYSIAVSGALVALHGAVAAASGSLAVTAELIHNFIDLVSAGAVLTGLKIATRKSRVFPYGLYKVENLAAAAIAVMVFFTAYEIVRSAYFGTSAQLHVDAWMFVLLIATLVIPLAFGHVELRAARSANSPALTAQAREYRVHAYTTGIAFAALLSAWFRFPLDRVAALVIVAAVIKTGWDLFGDAMRVLLDASLDVDSLNRIRQTIEADPAVAEVKWVTGRNAGRYRFVEAGVAMRLSELTKAEAAVRRIEKNVRNAVPQIERALVQMEARTSDRLRYAVPLADPSGIISEHLGEAPYFAFVTVDRNGAVREQRVLANPHRSLEKAKGIRVAEWLAAEKVDVVLVIKELAGKGPSYVLRDAGIEAQRTGKRTLSEVFPSQ
jgi:cation diffusion facilitator family transporter